MPQENVRVLLIDDQKIVAEGIRRMLEQETDIEFHYCQDPNQAINSAIELRPTVVLLDLVMPDVDGMTLTRFFRVNKQTKDIPIIVMSSNEDPATKRDAFSNGAHDYLVKLPDKIELIARLRAHSKRYSMQIERDEAFNELRNVKRQLERTNSILQKLSSLDALTEIANRRVFDESLAKEWKRSAREKTPLSVLLIDVDYFKRFNDHYGHQSGDEALRNVAEALAGVVKRSGDTVARYGGEEFGIVLPQTDAAGAKSVAAKFQQAVSELKIAHEKSSVCGIVTVSIGAATLIPEPNGLPESIVMLADKALYQAKKNGRNQAVCTSGQQADDSRESCA